MSWLMPSAISATSLLAQSGRRFAGLAVYFLIVSGPRAWVKGRSQTSKAHFRQRPLPIRGGPHNGEHHEQRATHRKPRRQP